MGSDGTVRLVFLAALTVVFLLPGSAAVGGDLDAGDSLGDVGVPLPDDIGEFIADTDAAIELGKALFWDEQVGGDGRVACATCHFSAGVDSRTENTINPGRNGMIDVDLPLDASDWPFDHDDIVGSQGVIAATFVDLTVGSAVDDCVFDDPDDEGDDDARQVTGRNTPPMITAIFNERNFWDGRARSEFNGVDGSGGEGMLWLRMGGGLVLHVVSLEPASMASQAVGPPNNEVEMSCLGRSFPTLGRKMISNGLTPLGLQTVADDDSVLGTSPLLVEVSPPPTTT